MISREDTWHGRYGVMPGYGISLQDGFQDTFTATATAALEWGAIPYAKGVIDNWLNFCTRPRAHLNEASLAPHTAEGVSVGAARL